MNAELFDEFAMSYLGAPRLNLAEVPHTNADYLLWQQEGAESLIAGLRGTHPGMPPIHFDYVDTDEVNAYAFMHKDHLFIGVTAAAAMGMLFLFRRMMSDRRILRGIGDPDTDIEHRSLKEPILESLKNEISMRGEVASPIGVRGEFCDFLARVAFDFLVGHEFTHIRNGHLGFIGSQGVPLLPEFGQASAGGGALEILQAFEIDADGGAATFISDFVAQWGEHPPSTNPNLQTYEQHLRGLSIAVFAFFRIFSDEPLVGELPFSRTHPPLRYRFKIFVQAFEDFLKFHGKIPTAKGLMAVAQGQRLVEEAFLIMTGDTASKPSPSRYIEGWDDSGKQYTERIKAVWHGGLREELLAHAYGSPMKFD